MKELTPKECVDRIKALKKCWKRSHIRIIRICQDNSIWYRIVDFTYKGKPYQYREDVHCDWIQDDNGREIA